jgi:hypothetical protein
MTRSAGCLCAVVVSCSLVSTAPWLQAQEPAAAAARRKVVAEVIRYWIDDYEHKRIAPKGSLQKDEGLQPRYARIARANDLLSERDTEALTHLEALHKLFVYAEHDVDEEIADALLRVASAGFDRSLVDLDAVVLRDAGHCALARVDHKGVWFLIMRAAAGERLQLWSGDQEPPDVDVARRVAALKLLGSRPRPVFRSTIEGALVDVDARVRLAAVEALAFLRRVESLDVLVRLLGVERHPIVSQAVVRAVAAALASGRGTLPAAEKERAVRAAMRMFGRAGWRTDMDLVDFVEQFPHRSAVPALIDVLARQPAGDKLVEAVNRDASPRLRRRAHECLRGLTGAILPLDRPDQWQEFWDREGDRIVVPERLPHTRTLGNTASTFFGIPVEGREIAFLIDTSGSMKEKMGGTSSGGRGEARQPTRLSVAKEQLLVAVQAMAPESRYHLLTFADGVDAWSRAGVPPTPAATRSLTEVLSQLRAEGGTNVHAGLVQALGLDELHFGQLGKQSIDELFVLSDGEPTVGLLRDSDELLALVREANKYLHVRIHCVFAGTPGGEGAEFLQRLAAENDGVFVQR